MGNKLSEDVLQDFASSAAGAYFSASHLSLNDAIVKIATANELLPDQIEYVSAEANKKVWKTLFDKNAESAYEFDIAKPQIIMEKLSSKNSTVVPLSMTSFDNDYAITPEKEPFNYASALGVKVAEDHSADEFMKTASATTSQRELLMKKADLESRQIHLQEDLHYAKIAFVKQATTMIANEESWERAAAYKTLAMFLKSAASTDIAKELLSKVAYVCQKTGTLEKRALSEAPEALITRDIPAKVINGNSTLYKCLKLVNDCNTELKCCGPDSTTTFANISNPIMKEIVKKI